ncbi:gas vesicle protein [Spartinivicinus poritis]|uniref:Gas vesicle protein n=1 Tax=Spartinivicinus poritis TaxID=2994640 RepID=A0ABT5U551_9GAMM|nr:gas vesicle protein [Spartinivicinus sp. A2-2]MDE1461478.1 gas vesicle protein [Spartinivicinus sp. A2-2]
MALQNQQGLRHATETTSVADLLERILDKGIVISGDIKIKLVDIELLSLEIRLVVCSVDKAVELGLDWWKGNSAYQATAVDGGAAEVTNQSVGLQQQLKQIDDRLARLENKTTG